MGTRKGGGQGLNRVIKKCRNKFRRPENTDYYSKRNYKKAERKYIKLCLEGKLET
jgi:hypothetical protein